MQLLMPWQNSIIGYTNNFMNISFEPTNKLVCTFLNQQSQSESEYSCDIAYGPCKQQPTIAQGRIYSNYTVIIDLSPVPQTSDYCYTVEANIGIFTTKIEFKGPITSSELLLYHAVLEV